MLLLSFNRTGIVTFIRPCGHRKALMKRLVIGVDVELSIGRLWVLTGENLVAMVVMEEKSSVYHGAITS